MAAVALLGAVWLAATPARAKPWKGAELISQQTFEFGAFEARIRAARGSGMITPFFLWKNDSEVAGVPWQEQDFEIFGRDGGYQTQLMTPGEGGEQRTEHLVYHSLPAPAWERYYTYRMEWTPEYLAFYVDGELVRLETDADEFAILMDPAQAEPAQLRMSLWAGDSRWSGSFDEGAVPAAVFVDWVQVSSYAPGQGPGGSDFRPLFRDDFDALDRSRWWTANWTFDDAVNDYVDQNVGVRDGKLVIVFTDEGSTGELPAPPPDNAASTAPSTAPPSSAPPPAGPPSAPGATSCNAEEVTYTATELTASTGGADGNGWNLWSAGTLSTQHEFGGGDTQLSVRAHGQLAAGEWPQMSVRVGGQVVGTFTVDSPDYTSYELEADVPPGSHEVSISFDNDYYQDGEDRNLYVEGLTIAECRE